MAQAFQTAPAIQEPARVCARCPQPTAGNSKYCKAHRAEARQHFLAMIQANAEKTAARRDSQNSAWTTALRAGTGHPVGTLIARPGNTSFARFLAGFQGAVRVPGAVHVPGVPGAELVARALESAVLDTRFAAEMPLPVARASAPRATRRPLTPRAGK